MKFDNHYRGRKGEEVACEYLISHGYTIVDRNVYTRYGELDIIAWKNGILIFVEVKSKTGHDFGEPWEMVGVRKKRQVRRMAEIYMVKSNRYHVHDTPCRVDVIGVWFDAEERVLDIKQWENIF